MAAKKLTSAQMDRKWQAESDARTLSEAATITADKGRAKRAVAAAKKVAVDAQKTVRVVSKQAGVRGKKK